MTGRRRAHRFSKRMISGIIFVFTSCAGGFAASLGAGLYTFVQRMFAPREMPFSLPEILFLLIGLVGVVLIVSDLRNTQRSTVRKRI
jgi:hypothetical protein